MTAEEIDDELRRLIALAARGYMRRGGRIGDLATDAGVCALTVSNLIYGVTKRPALATTLRIGVALGVSFKVEAPYDLVAIRRYVARTRPALHVH